MASSNYNHDPEGPLSFMEFSQQPRNNRDTKSAKKNDNVELLMRLFQPPDADADESQETHKLTSFFQISEGDDEANSKNGGSKLMKLFTPSPDKLPQESEQHDIKSIGQPPLGNDTCKSDDNETAELMNGVAPTEDDGQHQDHTQESTPINYKTYIRSLHDEVNDDVKTTPGAKMLLDLFEAPTSPTRSRWVSNTQATPERTNTKAGQHLLDLFSESSLVPPLVECTSPRDRCVKSSNMPTAPDHTTISYQAQTTPLLGGESSASWDSSITHQHECNNSNTRLYNSIPFAPAPMEPILEDFRFSRQMQLRNMVVTFAEQHLRVGTFLGGFIFLLYHIVFCLAMGSTISAGNLGIMAKMAASGIIFVSPIYIHFLGDEIPSQYPTTDLISRSVHGQTCRDCQRNIV